jgi:hypothetical protein
MESILVLFLPVALLYVGISLARGRALVPGAVMGRLSRFGIRGFKWLWKERSNRGGTGRTRRPPFRYRK